MSRPVTLAVPTFVFADVEVWLRHQPLDDTNWPAVVGARPVTLVAIAPVIRELDRRRGRAGTRDQAVTALRQIETWARSGQATIRPNVIGTYWRPYVPPKLAACRLDGRDFDQVVVAYARLFANLHVGQRVVVVTDNACLSALAERAGIEVVAAPDAGYGGGALERSIRLEALRTVTDTRSNAEP